MSYFKTIRQPKIILKNQMKPSFDKNVKKELDTHILHFNNSTPGTCTRKYAICP